MIVMLDSPKLDEAEADMGVTVEQLLTPLTRFRRAKPGMPFAVDNGAFSSFDSAAFLSLLEREKPHRDLCRWVAVPDVVGSARRTLECFDHWRRVLRPWPLALVAQDGQETLPIPWGFIEAVFIGGTTEWKTSQYAEQIIKAGKIMGKWVHVGRVNTPNRFDHFRRMGVDSIDGTGLALHKDSRQTIGKRVAQTSIDDALERARKGGE